MTRYINTLNFGRVPIRKTHTEGVELEWIEMSDEGFASIRKDVRTQQPFAVLYDDILIPTK